LNTFGNWLIGTHHAHMNFGHVLNQESGTTSLQCCTSSTGYQSTDECNSCLSASSTRHCRAKRWGIWL